MMDKQMVIFMEMKMLRKSIVYFLFKYEGFKYEKKFSELFLIWIIFSDFYELLNVQ